MRNNRRSGAAARPFAARAKRRTSPAGRPQPMAFQNLQRSYEQYLALARAEVQNGNTIAAENYYQHAEHYFRSMSSKET
jgi:Domain of unknown function (DUF4167)